MKLKRLLQDLAVEVHGSKEVEVTGICANSKLVIPGNLFVAKKGSAFDGRAFIQDAIAAGAVAILTEQADPFLKNITQIVHPNVAAFQAVLAAKLYGWPSQQLLVVGITGTNGKTTSAYLVKHLLDALGYPCGLIGTVEYIVGHYRYPAILTTPDVCMNHKLLGEMVLNGCKAVVMEVTAHALVQGRNDGIDFDIGVYTNLSHDHLDYFQTMENYADAKGRFFQGLGGAQPALGSMKKPFAKCAVINQDCAWHIRMEARCSVPIMHYGLVDGAELTATQIRFSTTETQFKVHYKGQVSLCTIALVGRYNVYNCLGVIGVGLALGFSLEQIAAALKSFKSVPGRLEAVPNNKGKSVFVDYAHTPDALEKVLASLKELAQGRIITVFGCGGNRDREKRPVMARISEKFSDLSIVTTDNPRNEEPELICQEIIAGFAQAKKYHVELDRRKAIERAIQEAGDHDVVLIAGKGHEPYQIFARQTIQFNDREVAQEVIAQL